jgi:dienelactone hydrolase
MFQLLLTLCLLAFAAHQEPRLYVAQPAGKGIDQEVKIQVDRLAPQQCVEIEARTVDTAGAVWSSHAHFQADSQGLVDLSRHRALEHSSYMGIDGMGLFWSMQSGDPYATYTCKDRCDMELTLRVDGTICDAQRVSRYLKLPEIVRVDVREQGLVATLFLPPTPSPPPVIITLSGSNGGLSDSRGKLLASHGFAVLSLAYFGADGLPANLEKIPLEYFESAFAYLKGRPDVDASRVGLYGVSRGAELALLLGAYFPDAVQAIVAMAPSSTVYGTLGDKSIDAWVYQDKPVLPFAPVPPVDFSTEAGKTPEGAISTLQNFLYGMQDTQGYEAAAIPVERIRCPLLLITGGDDQMWPSRLYAEQIIERLQLRHSPIVWQHLHYSDAGHGIRMPYLPSPEPVYFHPMGQRWFSMGGSRAADAHASADSWDKLVTFFTNTLLQ